MLNHILYMLLTMLCLLSYLRQFEDAFNLVDANVQQVLLIVLMSVVYPAGILFILYMTLDTYTIRLWKFLAKEW